MGEFITENLKVDTIMGITLIILIIELIVTCLIITVYRKKRIEKKKEETILNIIAAEKSSDFFSASIDKVISISSIDELRKLELEIIALKKGVSVNYFLQFESISIATAALLAIFLVLLVNWPGYLIFGSMIFIVGLVTLIMLEAYKIEGKRNAYIEYEIKYEQWLKKIEYRYIDIEREKQINNLVCLMQKQSFVKRILNCEKGLEKGNRK